MIDLKKESVAFYVRLLFKEKEAIMSRNTNRKIRAKNILGLEKGFQLPLSTIVEGQDKSGKTFKEKTIPSYISQNGASFWLNHPVFLECPLKLISDLPPKLSQNKNLKLITRGQVIFIEAVNGKKTKQRVTMKFKNQYIIKEES